MNELFPIPVNHDELVTKAEKWLRNTCGCGVVFAEFKASTNEIPDVLGWKWNYSILVECKTSRSDFLADKKKPFRKLPESGMGNYRFFLTPENLVTVKDLPQNWGLLYSTKRGIKVVHGAERKVKKGGVPNCFTYHQEANIQAEKSMLISACRRLHLRGLLSKIYEPLNEE